MNAFEQWQHLQDRSFLYQAVRADGEESYWSRFALNYDQRRHSGHGLGEELEIVLDLIEPSMSVLEIGAGTGAFTLPIARKAASVTVVEPSPSMIRILEEKLRRHDIRNVAIRQGRWQDTEAAVHDVVLAAGCIYVFYDLAAVLSKMAAHARRLMILTSGVGDSARLYGEAAGLLGVAVPAGGPDYIHLCHALYQMGLHADVRILRSVSDLIFDTPEHAVAVWAERLKLPPDKIGLLHAYFSERLRPLPSGQMTLGEIQGVKALLWHRCSG
jgi:SAM-dependent methyltransferase